MARTSGGDPDGTVELLWTGDGSGDGSGGGSVGGDGSGGGPGSGDGGAGARPGLSLDRIVRAAVEVADAEGLAGLSMRKVAERLGFTTMSLYRHVPGRDHLVDLMRDAVLAEEPGPPPAGSWRERLEACARQGWELRRRHPWLAEVRGGRHVPGPNAVALYDRMLDTLRGTGLPPGEIVAAVGLVGRFLDAEAQTLNEAAEAERDTGVSDEEWWGARDSLFARLDRYPTLTWLWESGAYDDPADPFEFGLARVLDGIEVLIRRRAAPDPSRDVTRDETAPCRECGTAVTQPSSGRPREYCSRACRQRAYRRRKSR
ncbi:TetR/AcrR family transcriptional regulator [Bailinhaonella thermotolerans]|uniref:TetR/AcrR family transcriptional regulator n=1 Tax=Bailinhaonella thermotolerans TaxID=1070861 RepID=A0A3A4AF82_9ACTN|nr:TetR/AcrR family transcriptional regulator [Bailinhaonella thermotolerans]RJL27171.1 TetR/AcrR family transcriptional regulator [Bailinhaonella thermotolerans]